MLIHRQTLGVLETAPWDGSFCTINGVRVPVLRPASLQRLGLDPAEWWEVPDGSTLANVIHSCWPWFDPIVESGELVGVERWPAWRVYGESAPLSEKAMPPRRRRRRKAPLKLG